MATATYAKLADRELAWEKTKEKESWYRLSWDGNEWLRLRIGRRMGTLAQARSKDQAWTFKRMGCFHPHLTVRREGEHENIAVFSPSWTGSGLLEFADGRMLRWKATRSFGREWAWVTSDQEVLMRFQGRPDKCRTHFESAIRSEKEAPLLTALGHYLIQLMTNDAALMGGVAAASAAAAAAG